MAIDLSFVPSSFWSEESQRSQSYYVAAAAHGLVCIASNGYCVLNTLKHTCIVLPEPPFRRRLLLLTSTSVGILAWSDPETAPQTLLSATYDLLLDPAAEGGGWVSVCKLVLPRDSYCVCDDGPSCYCNWPPDGTLLGGQAYWYASHYNKVHVVAAGGVQVIDAPSVTLLGLPSILNELRWAGVRVPGIRCYQRTALVAHRGKIYFVAELETRTEVCGVWRIATSDVDGRLEWEGVALLDEAELEMKRVTGTRFRGGQLAGAYGAGESHQ